MDHLILFESGLLSGPSNHANEVKLAVENKPSARASTDSNKFGIRFLGIGT